MDGLKGKAKHLKKNCKSCLSQSKHLPKVVFFKFDIKACLSLSNLQDYPHIKQLLLDVPTDMQLIIREQEWAFVFFDMLFVTVSRSIKKLKVKDHS